MKTQGRTSSPFTLSWPPTSHSRRRAFRKCFTAGIGFAWLATVAAMFVFNLQAQPLTALKVEEVSYFYDEPYLLDYNFALRNQNGAAVITDPAQITVVCKEDGTAISASETGFRLLAAANKQLKCFLVLDYTLSMADPAVNGDADGDGISDAIETMEAAAKTLIGTLNADAQVGLYEFHREDAAHPPSKVSDLTVDKAGLTNHIDRIWTDYVKSFPAGTRVWDAVYAAVEEYPTTRLVDEQRVVVFLSDGRDESSTRTPNDVINSAQARGVKVYAIGFGNELTPAPLQSIASSTGGRYYAAPSLSQLAARFQQITDDLRGNYVLRWATLKRSGSFTPSFTLAYKNLNDTFTGSRYSPGDHAGDVLQGRLVFDAALDEGVATVGLRAYYVPRFITRVRLNYTTDKPLTVQKVPLAEGGVVPDNWVFEHNAAQGWIELRSPNPQNIFTALPYATQGKLVRFTLTGVNDLSTCFSNFKVDNTLYLAGGQSFRILNTSLVGRQPQTIAFAVLSDRTVSMSPFPVSATASSGLPVTYRIVGGPATMSGNSVALTNVGRVTIRAEQAGNENYSAAFAEQSFDAIDKLPHNTPLEWLAQYGLTNNLVQGELLDLDADGQAMWQEYWAGTNPTNAASVLALSGRFLQEGGWQLSFLSQMYRKYQLDYSDDLLTWTVWQTEAQGDGKIKSYLASPMVAKRFYRLVQTEFKEPPPGMVWIAPGIFTMGSPASEADRFDDEVPQTTVTISQGFWMGKYEVTQAEYQAVIGSNPSSFKGDLNRPVETVFWNEATDYCVKLTEKERQAKRLPAGHVYRLPTEAEWEYGARAGSTTRFSYGDDPGYAKLKDYTWYADNSGFTTHPVGQKLANAWGLYDMQGNAWECCRDWYGTYPGGSVTDPQGPSSGSYRVIRGGSWSYDARYCRSAVRGFLNPDNKSFSLGFRVVLAPDQTVIPTSTDSARPKMVLIKPGTFTMGSPANEVDRSSNEGPQTQVTISQGFWMGQYEVTQAEYQTVTGSNPSFFMPDLNRPVEQVGWNDATDYCVKLTERERASGRLPAGHVYRLPTEAEWEYAARAGSTTRFSYGDDPGYGKLGDYAWYLSNSDNRTHPAGLKLANAWGLYDMHGNASEWCRDWYGSYPGGNVTDPRGPSSGSSRVFRGGSWINGARHCRSANRLIDDPGGSYDDIGFRVVMAPGQP